MNHLKQCPHCQGIGGFYVANASAAVNTMRASAWYSAADDAAWVAGDAARTVAIQECSHCNGIGYFPSAFQSIVNLTPHPITILEKGNIPLATFHATRPAARCSQSTSIVGGHPISEDIAIPLSETTFGKVVGLPNPIPGVRFIVSRLVMSACPDRTDLLVPNELVRGEDGNIIGCRSLAVN